MSIEKMALDNSYSIEYSILMHIIFNPKSIQFDPKYGFNIEIDFNFNCQLFLTTGLMFTFLQINFT